jgi:hypothetical protein
MRRLLYRALRGLRIASWHVAFALAFAIVIAAALRSGSARGQDRNFAGSIQASYLYVHDEDQKASQRAFDGFTTELSAKLAVDFDQHISTNVKMCYGCHGFEIDMAYIDLTAVDEFRVRVGRFNPSFGEFTLRHDPANHRTVDKPLPYDMGRMVRMREYNLGVLPAPYVDNGIELGGTHWFGYAVQLDYAAYGVSGLQGNPSTADVDFKQTRGWSNYYVDNNSRPSGGGRLAMTLDFSEAESTFTLGASGMAGWYDPAAKLSYWLAGADFYARIKNFELRAEYLLRRTEMGMENASTRFKYGPGKDGQYDAWVLKDGFYVEALVPVLPRLQLVGRFDGLRRFGNVVNASPLSKRTQILRSTLGTDISLGYGVRVKLAAEHYYFTDFKDEIVGTVGVAAVL